MLTDYIQAAMRQAHYEIWAEEGVHFGSVPGFQGVWAQSKTLEECRKELQEVLEDWILVGLKLGHTLPVVDGMDLNIDVKKDVA